LETVVVSPILFPTDERYLPKQHRREISCTGFNPELVQKRPTLARVGSGGLNSRLENGIPISTNGTPLVRGHDREVGNLAWTYDGELVTVGDDFSSEIMAGRRKRRKRFEDGW
jgi:hypothetical protein